jgi:hypothetical protein
VKKTEERGGQREEFDKENRRERNAERRIL